MTTDPKAAKYGPVVAVVNSASDLGKKYEVRQSHEGELTCACMGWRFNKDRPRKCRHTEAAQGRGKILPMTPQAVSAAHAQGVGPSISSEAARVAREILNLQSGHMSVAPSAISKASSMVEAAIRKFMGALPSMPAVAEATTELGVRMITLDD